MNAPRAPLRILSPCLQGFAAAVLLLGIAPCAIRGQAPQNHPPNQEIHHLHGVVRDQEGAPVSGATVTIDCAQLHMRLLTPDDGAFAFEAAANCAGKINVTAAGFAEARVNFIATDAGTGPGLEITLNPAPLYQSVAVTATRAPRSESNAAAATSDVTALDLQNWAGESVDDKLRQVLGFSLYRRSGSETANPTTQGISLRGLGANGASRALVLADGIPLNDPFGGWVFWDQVPEQEIDRIEVVEGGMSDLYGSTALGGVVEIETKPPLDTNLSLESSLGNELTAFSSAHATLRSDLWAISTNRRGLPDGWLYSGTGVAAWVRGFRCGVEARGRRRAHRANVCGKPARISARLIAR